MSSYLSDAMDRIVAMQKEALNTLTGGKVDAVTYWPYQQNDYPYFINRLGALSLDNEYGEDIDGYIHVVLMRLVVGHITEGYKGETPANMYDYIPAVQAFFRNNPMLTSTANPTAPDYLFYEARIISHTGFVVFSQGGIGQLQVGCEFTLQLPYLREIDIEE
jgi:hypothetical protein